MHCVNNVKRYYCVIMDSNGLAVRRRPQKYQKTWRAVPGVRTSQWLGQRF